MTNIVYLFAYLKYKESYFSCSSKQSSFHFEKNLKVSAKSVNYFLQLLNEHLCCFSLGRLQCLICAGFSLLHLPLRLKVCPVCTGDFSVADGKTEWLRGQTCGGRAAVMEVSCSGFLWGMLQEQVSSRKSKETYFTLLILSIVLNEGHFRPRAHLCIVCLCCSEQMSRGRRSFSSAL